MIKISSGRSYKTLRSGDDDFMFSPDGIMMVPRASFEIDDNCPDNYFHILQTAINKKWIRSVAHMRDTEYTMELLRK
jgi:hypothetical protein